MVAVGITSSGSTGSSGSSGSGCGGRWLWPAVAVAVAVAGVQQTGGDKRVIVDKMEGLMCF